MAMPPVNQGSPYEMDVLEGHDSVLDDDAIPQSPKLQSRHKANDYWVGLAILLIVVLLWTASSFIMQALYESGYDKPFLVTYATTGPFALYLVPQTVCWVWGKRRGHLAAGYRRLSVAETSESSAYDQPIDTDPSLKPLTVRQTANVAFIFCWLWFIANWTVNASLNYTTVASSTIVVSTSGFFTLGIGQAFGVERFTPLKLFAVFICFLGVVLVSYSDSESSGQTSNLDPHFQERSQPLLGDTFAFISAIFYAVYVVFLKVKIGIESRINMRLFLGFVGLFNLLTCWPVGVLLHWLRVETFELPSVSVQWYAILANTIIFLLSDYLYVLSMLKTTPLVVTTGISLTIPVAVVGDFIINAPVRGQVIVGAILVLISFVTIGLDGSKEKET